MQLASIVTPGALGPVVLVHGLTQQKHFWDPVIARLSGIEVHAVDGRGHGDSGGELHDDYRISTCASDLVEYCERGQLTNVTLVGHSWGAAVVLAAAPQIPCHAVVALDGGFVRMADLGDRATVRERLLPPRLGITRDQLLDALSHGSLAPYWGDEIEAALMPSFTTNDAGLMVSTIGYDRHLAVLDGLLDHEPEFSRLRMPTWIVACEPVRIDPSSEYHGQSWQNARDLGLARAAQQLPDPRIIRLAGAIHDVPLAWPDLTAGLVRTAVQ